MFEEAEKRAAEAAKVVRIGPRKDLTGCQGCREKLLAAQTKETRR